MVYLISTYDRPYLDSKNYGFRSTYKLKTSKSNLFQSCLFPFFIYTWCKRRDKPTLVCCGSFWMMTSVLNLQTWEALMPMCTPLLPSVGNNMQEPYYSTLFWNPVLQSGFISFIGPPSWNPLKSRYPANIPSVPVGHSEGDSEHGPAFWDRLRCCSQITQDIISLDLIWMLFVSISPKAIQFRHLGNLPGTCNISMPEEVKQIQAFPI